MRRDITLSERLAVALVSLVSGGVTVATLAVVAFFAGLMFTTEYLKTTAFWTVVGSMGAGVAGFFLGSERAAYWFGILWGTQKPTEKELGLVLGFVILVCGAIVYVALT